MEILPEQIQCLIILNINGTERQCPSEIVVGIISGDELKRSGLPDAG
jgi:hypothetical protein